MYMEYGLKQGNAHCIYLHLGAHVKRTGWSRSELMKRRELFIHLSLPKAQETSNSNGSPVYRWPDSCRGAQYRYGKTESALFFVSGAYQGSYDRETWRERHYHQRVYPPLPHSPTMGLAEQWNPCPVRITLDLTAMPLWIEIVLSLPKRRSGK